MNNTVKTTLWMSRGLATISFGYFIASYGLGADKSSSHWMELLNFSFAISLISNTFVWFVAMIYDNDVRRFNEHFTMGYIRWIPSISALIGLVSVLALLYYMSTYVLVAFFLLCILIPYLYKLSSDYERQPSVQDIRSAQRRMWDLTEEIEALRYKSDLINAEADYVKEHDVKEALTKRQQAIEDHINFLKKIRTDTLATINVNSAKLKKSE